MGNDQAKNLRKLMKERAKCRTIFFSSGREKVGKSTVVTNLASLLSQNDYKTMILDSGSGFFRSDVLLNVSPRYGIMTSMNANDPIENNSVKINENLDVIYMRPLFEAMKTSEELRTKLIGHLDRLRDTYDFILVDLEELDIVTLKGIIDSDTQFVFVLSSESLKCLKPTYSMIKQVESGTDLRDVSIILNKVLKQELAEEIRERLSIACDKFLGVKVTSLGYIKNDNKVTASFRSQTPIALLDEECEISNELRDLFSNMILN